MYEADRNFFGSSQSETIRSAVRFALRPFIPTRVVQDRTNSGLPRFIASSDRIKVPFPPSMLKN